MIFRDPLMLDRAFQEIMEQLHSSPSERVRIRIIGTFIEGLSNSRFNVNSYVSVLVNELPPLDKPLFIAGFRPEYLKELIDQLETIQGVDPSSEEKLSESITNYRSALRLLHNWAGERVTQEEVTNDLVISDLKEKEVRDDEYVLIPVVEHHHPYTSGRLRRLKVEVVGTTGDKPQLRPLFGVLGAESGTLLENPEKAAAALLKDSGLSAEKGWKAVASFESNHAWHQGRSANLGIAAAFYCEMLKAAEVAEYFTVNPAACLSGDIDEEGNVLEVDEQSLPLKVEAAFFSWAQILVVPATQLEQARKKVDELNIEYPNRELPVAGVHHLRDLFFDRRLSLHHRTNPLTYQLRKAWKGRAKIASLGIIGLLITVIILLISEPIDENPVTIDFEGINMVLKNKNGRVIESIETDKRYIDLSISQSNYQRHLNTLVDVDNDGVNEFFYTYNDGKKFQNSTITGYSFTGDSVIWKKTVGANLDYSFRPDHKTLDWSVMALVPRINPVTDNKVIYVQVASGNFFTSLILQIDMQTGKTLQTFVHPGHLRTITVFDTNDDGVDELFATGLNNSYWGAKLLMLDTSNMDGQAPAGDDYLARGVEQIQPLAMVHFPKTIIGQQYPLTKGTDPFLIKVIVDRIEVFVNDGAPLDESGNYNLSPFMVYEFDYQLNLTSLGSSNSWDIAAKSLYEQGKLPFKPGIEYLNAFKDSLLWWDGTEFQSEPTLNKKYQELPGVDSDQLRN